MPMMSKDQMDRLVGDPKVATRRLRAYQATAKVFSSKTLIDEYPNQWVAAYEGKFVGHATSLPNLRAELKARDIPLRDAMVRFITNSDRALIL